VQYHILKRNENISDISGRFATGVNGTDGKQLEQFQTGHNLK
jgi:hypothetical protein